ncbi:hypothetical protein ABE073_04135 [Lederbergia citrisecunda]|uniref:hypothetical protein n=1 Tax=Lederbergia citrisecunda TaxID=2833583 RepID=UPI003D27B93E
MVKLKCKENYCGFEKGKVYNVKNNHTTVFELSDDSGTVHKFSKTYDGEYPNFRKHFEVVSK